MQHLWFIADMFESWLNGIQLSRSDCIKVGREFLGKLVFKWTAAIIWSKHFLTKVDLFFLELLYVTADDEGLKVSSSSSRPVTVFQMSCA